MSLTNLVYVSYRQFYNNGLISPCQVFFKEFSSYESITTDHPPALFELMRDFFCQPQGYPVLKRSHLIIRYESRGFLPSAQKKEQPARFNKPGGHLVTESRLPRQSGLTLFGLAILVRAMGAAGERVRTISKEMAEQVD